MQQQPYVSHGVKWGFIIGLVYSALLYLRFSTGATDPLMHGIWTMVGYLVVLVLLLVSGFLLRKKVGGYIEMKDIFKALFLSVLIFEFFFVLFHFIYLKYIDPDFYIHLRDATEQTMRKAGQSQGKIDETLGKLDVRSGKEMTIFDMLKSYLMWISASGMIALLFSLIIRRKPVVRPQQDEVSQP
ncbi:MAG TPA: DUF4199 domain-containing protein [Flavisolibacter sp.]